MLFRLVIEKNGKRSRVVEIRTPNAVIGRAHGNTVRIPSAQVSRKHCQLRARDGLVTVEDLESVNGTYLNDSLITGPAVVRPGDHLEVGPITFFVEYDLTPRALERLRQLDYEVVEEAEAEDVVLEVEEDEETTVQPKAKTPRRPPVQEEVFDVEEVVEEEEFIPSIDLEDVSWTAPEDGDLRDMLSQLDEGQESQMPKKRPMPRKKRGEQAEPSPPKSGKGKARKPDDLNRKRRPESDE